MSIPVLKKKLADLERKELEKMLCDIYINCEQAEQMLNIILLDEMYGRKLLEQYQDKLDKIFFPYDIVRAGFSLSMAKKVLSDFKKICQNIELISELKLYFVECGTEFTNMYGDMDERFYNVVCNIYHDVIESVSGDKTLFEKWNDRLINIVQESDGIGWGFHDYLIEEEQAIMVQAIWKCLLRQKQTFKKQRV